MDAKSASVYYLYIRNLTGCGKTDADCAIFTKTGEIVCETSLHISGGKFCKSLAFPAALWYTRKADCTRCTMMHQGCGCVPGI